MIAALLLSSLAATPNPAVSSTVGDDGAVLIRLGGQVVDADDAGAPPVYTGTPIDLDVQQAELASVLRLISAVSHLNFVLDDSVHGTVTVHLEDVPWDQALDAILQSKGLVAVPMGSTLRLVQPIGR